MAGGGKRGGGDRVLESRHLVGLFLGVVLLCGVFFTLGYVMGHNQYDGAVHAESPARSASPAPVVPADNAAAAAAPAQPAGGWDFYPDRANKKDAAKPDVRSITPQPADADLPMRAAEPAPAAVLAPAKATRAALPAKPVKGSIILQVAALRHQSDALGMADLLQKKKFPAFVATPAGGDSLYRIQVGPYATEAAADSAKAALDRAGFKAIIKR